MAAAVQEPTTPTFRDIDRGVLRVMDFPGVAFWIWIGFCFSLVAIAAILLDSPDL